MRARLACSIGAAAGPGYVVACVCAHGASADHGDGPAVRSGGRRARLGALRQPVRLLPRLERARRVERTGPDAVGARAGRRGRQAARRVPARRAGPTRGCRRFSSRRIRSKDLATFLHAAIFLNANRRLYQVLDILTGDPKAGEAYFAGAGKCATLPLADGRSEGRRREVRRRHAAGPPADAARRPRRGPAAAGLPRQERDQGVRHAAVAADRSRACSCG